MAKIATSGLTRFLRSNVSGSILLIVATLIAMIMANSNLKPYYDAICNVGISLIIGGKDILSHGGNPMDFSLFVNDVLMAVFFFSVGLEIKREILVGELSSVKRAMLPIIAALGGIIFPVLIFYFISKGTPAMSGMAIPMATDIAFSLGILSLLGKRVPIGLKIFLMALAVADDLGGILVIAIFYSSHISVTFLILAAAVAILMFVIGQRGVNNVWLYLLLGIVLWFMVYNSGVHSTIAGVVAAFAIPAKPKLNLRKYFAKLKNNLRRFPENLEIDKNGVILLNHDQIDILHRIERSSNRVMSPLQRIEDVLHPIVNFIIIPIFAFVNAGVVLGAIDIATLTSNVTVGCFTGLMLGKFLGIFLFSYIAIKSRAVFIPNGVTMKQIAGVSVIGGIGFTVSLFIANLSFGNVEGGLTMLNEAKIGILSASFLSGLIGFFALKYVLPKESQTEEYEEDIDNN